jgi:hypothetical protein
MAAVSTTGLVGKRASRTYVAGAAAQGRGYVVTQGASDGAAVTSTGNAPPLGIQEESSVNAGDPISITRDGEAYAVIGAAVNAGQYVISDALGRVVPSTAVGDNVVGQAMSSGTTINDEIVVFVRPFIR